MGKEFEVAGIHDVRQTKKGKKTEMVYLVSWVGYDQSANTWEPLSNLGNAKHLVTQYHRDANQKPAKKAPKTKHAEDTEEYEIEAILAHKKSRGKGRPSYKIRWSGYGSEDDTWEPEKNLVETGAVILKLYQETNELPPASAPAPAAKKAATKTAKGPKSPAKGSPTRASQRSPAKDAPSTPSSSDKSPQKSPARSPRRSEKKIKLAEDDE